MGLREGSTPYAKRETERENFPYQDSSRKIINQSYKHFCIDDTFQRGRTTK